ncbi:MAG TPA: hypothetical protein VE978_13490 [Chitinophagales bacterium]|nr:hypothetical protein [Chitinophagales bacterium]
MMEILISLSVNMLIKGESIEISYTVVNRSERTIYLTNLAVRTIEKKGPIPDPSLAFIYFEKDTIHIAKRYPTIPKDKFFTPLSHYVTPIASNQSFSEKFSIPFPIHEVIPYLSKNDLGIQTKKHFVDFSLGYVISDSSIEAVELVRDAHKVYLLRANPRVEEKDLIKPMVENFLSSNIFQLEIPVLE